MIDAHVHVYPDLEALVAPLLLGRAPEPMRRAVEPPLRASLATARVVAERLPAASPLSVRRLAALDDRLPAAAMAAIEQVTGVVGTLTAVPRANTDGLVRSMDRSGIATSVVIGSFEFGPNDWLLRSAASSRGRLVPVVTAPPLGDAAEADWAAAFADLADRGAAGFKIHPNLEGVGPKHPSVTARFAVAAERGLFVILHTGCFHVPIYEEQTPIDLAAFAGVLGAHPTVRTCLAHMNRGDPEALCALMRDLDHLYTDTSWAPPDVIARTVAEVGADRVMLGSDWPLLHLGLQAESVAIAREALDDADFAAVTSSAPARFLGIDPP